jgi:hypothetical protein
MVSTLATLAAFLGIYAAGFLSYPLWQDRKRRNRELDQQLFDRAVRR